MILPCWSPDTYRTVLISPWNIARVPNRLLFTLSLIAAKPLYLESSQAPPSDPFSAFHALQCTETTRNPRLDHLNMGIIMPLMCMLCVWDVHYAYTLRTHHIRQVRSGNEHKRRTAR